MTNKLLALVLSFILFASKSGAQINLNAGLVAYYPFNGNFLDQSGNGNNGVAQNGATLGTDQWGNPNNAAFFDGIDDWVSIAPSVSLTSSKRATIAFRFKSNSTAQQIVITKADVNPTTVAGITTIDSFQYQLGFNCNPPLPSNDFYFGTNHNNQCVSNQLASDYAYAGTIVPNTWYCIAAVFDSGIKRIYVNGALAVQQPVAFGTNPSYIDSCTGGTLRFGFWWASDPRWFNGLLDEVRIYNRALNVAEIDSICNYVTQPEITINDYAAVLDYNPCQNAFAVDTATNFSVGDTVLVVQMKGAVIDTSNTANFGNILSYNNCGNYEYNTVKTVSGNIISLTYNLQRSYDIPDGKVQLVKVPYFQSYTLNQPHTCMPWTGSKGGIFAVNVANTLTLNNSVNVTGKGFKGGAINNGLTYTCDLQNYYYPFGSNDGGLKGEGIAEISLSKMRGKGKLGNGGGGGNSTNAGGGGGSNAGVGGVGGHQWGNCNVNLLSGGDGGAGLNYNSSFNKIFLGGGGGAGHQNDNNTDPGGNGGGIVIIQAGSITGTDVITANGNDCIDQNSVSATSGDGQSGGGGGGTVFINANTISSGISIDANGGNGGNIYASSLHGPGGGGSGGAVLFSNAAVSGTAINIAGGNNGTNINFSDAHFSQPGVQGVTISNYPIAPPLIDSFFSINIAVNFADSFISCFTLQFYTTGPNQNVSAWYWQFGDGTTGTGNPVSHTYATNGSYVVTLVVSDSLGCSDTITQTISVNGPNADFTISNNSVCIGQPVTFSASPTGQPAASYSWNFDDGTVATGSQTTHSYNAAGTYTVMLYFADTSGCADTVSHTVSVDSVHADFTVSNDTVCSGQPIAFTSNATGPQPLTYDWGFGDGGTASTPSTTHSYNTDGTYTVLLIVTSPGSCADTIEKTIYVGNPAPDSLTATICADSSFMFGAQLIDTAGIYTQIFTSTSGCDSIVILSVDMIPQPSVNFTSTTALNMPVTFTNTSSNATSFLWEFGDGATSNDFSPVHQYATAGTHTVCLTGWNDEGCSEKVCKEILTEIFTALDVPLAFSPNGDGNNDVLYVRGGGVKEMTFRIYNRWGQMIFESHSLNEGWDGKFKGKPQDLETVAYILQATFIDGTTVQKQGNVTILH